MIDKVNAYFDQTYFQYKKVWQVHKHHGIHYGYWDKETKNHAQAVQKLNQVVIETADLKENSSVADFGCGVGGTCFLLAGKYGHRVTGININRGQLEIADETARNLDLSDKIDFLNRDFLETGLPSGEFDCVFAVESICHCQSRPDFLKEAYRLLKPGGKLALAAYFVRDKQVLDTTPIRRWLKNWAIPDLETTGSFKAMLIAAGFRGERFIDISGNIRKSSIRLFIASLPGAVKTEILHILKPLLPYARNHYKSAFWQYVALRKGYWMHMVVSASKPVDQGEKSLT